MQRRQFLSSVATMACSSHAWAVNSTTNVKMLFVFLRGAYDGLNCLIPYQDSFYYEARPRIHIPNEQSIVLTNDFALHPALGSSIAPLFGAKQALFIHASGSQDNSRSHFHAQDMMEFGYLQGDYQSGFLNRLLQQLQPTSFNATSYTNNLPTVFKGSVSVANISLKGKINSNINERQEALYRQMYQGNALGSYIQQGIDLRKHAAQELQEMDGASRQANTVNGFAQETRRIAQLMREQPKTALGFIDIGGWDTHINQGASQGVFANSLQILGTALAEFKDQMQNQWTNTLVVVISEFGRTVRENGNVGTDHGHGNVMWLLGGSIQGGRVAGNWEGLKPQFLHENRDLPVLNDYRNVLGNIFSTVFSLNPSQLQAIFPGYKKQDFKLV